MCYHTHHILQTSQLSTITCFDLCRIFLIVQASPQIRTWKTTWTSFLPARFKHFMSVASISGPKDDKRYWIKIENIYFHKMFYKIKKNVFFNKKRSYFVNGSIVFPRAFIELKSLHLQWICVSRIQNLYGSFDYNGCAISFWPGIFLLLPGENWHFQSLSFLV